MKDYNPNYSGQSQQLEDQIADYQLHQEQLEQEHARLERRLRTQGDDAYADPSPAPSAPADAPKTVRTGGRYASSMAKTMCSIPRCTPISPY